MMTVGEAIQTALQFEHSVRSVYEDAAARAADPVAKKTLLVLAGEEQGHVQYLEERLAEWKRDGKVCPRCCPPSCRRPRSSRKA
jgi:rubrerythrin